ncbi:MAG: hypothetical protein GXY33_05370 [Phycisphaerae bacterium]|mgnify:CR=1 FL=1|nr:hypothetical protein [Phycisphaerae bacterium]
MGLGRVAVAIATMVMAAAWTYGQRTEQPIPLIDPNPPDQPTQPAQVSEVELIEPDEPGGSQCLRITRQDTGRKTYPLAAIESPAISAVKYGIAGWAQWETVEGTGWFEVWTVLADGTRYVQKAALGPDRARTFKGDQTEWAAFELTFTARDDPAARPARMGADLVLDGPGAVVVSQVALVEYPGETLRQPSIFSWSRAFWVPFSSLTMLASLGLISILRGKRRLLAVGLLLVSAIALVWKGFMTA